MSIMPLLAVEKPVIIITIIFKREGGGEEQSGRERKNLKIKFKS